MRNAKLVREVKQLAKQRYTSVGSYPLFLVMADGECLCADCVREEFKRIGRATRDNERPGGWCAATVDVNWESELFCANCNKQIESAYGVPEEDTDEQRQ